MSLLLPLSERIGLKSNDSFRRLLLCVVVFITFFVNNRVLVPDIMESRNMVTAREMVEKGNWLLPTMNDQPRLEKPPLPTWISGAIEAVDPGNLALHRLAASLAGLLLLFYFYRFARRCAGIDPVIATLVLVTCYNFLLMARTASWDIYTHAFMMGAIYYFAVATRGAGRQLGRFALSGLMIGLSLMSKGPVSLFALFLPFIIAWTVTERPKMGGKWAGVGLMAVVAVVVGGWWYAYVHAAAGEELQAVIAKESGAWTNRNVRPWYYYHLFFAETGAWSLLLLTSIAIIGSRAKQAGRRSLMPLLWMAACLVLLSCMPEKKTRYLLPMLIPAALLMGQTIDYWRSVFSEGQRPRIQTIAFGVNCYLLFAVVAAMPVVAYFTVVARGFMSAGAFIAFAIVAEACAAALFMAAKRLRPRAMVWAVGWLFAGASATAMPAVGHLINNPEMTGLELTVGDRRLENLPFYSVEGEETRIELVYAARRDIKPLDVSDPAAVKRALPFALLTHGPVAEVMTQEALERVDTLSIGVFDCNRRPKGTRRYGPQWIYNLTIISASDTAGSAPAVPEAATRNN